MQSIINKNYLRYAEYGLLALIIGLMALFFLNRVRTVHKNAERMAVMGEINALRAGIVSLQEPPEGLSNNDLPGMNPVLVLQTPPRSYLGSVRDPRDRDIPPGSWYFYSVKGLLIYKARFAHDFPFTREPTQKIRLALESPNRLSVESERHILACRPNICLTFR